jgi:hypothetical protein
LAQQLGLRLATELRPDAVPSLPGIPVQRAHYPVDDALASLLPEAGLAGQIGIDATRPGAATLLFHLVAAATSSGRWCAVVDVPGLYPLAARAAGVDLDRFALIDAGPEARPTVLGALCAGVPIIVAPSMGLTPRQLQRAASRAARSGSVLVWWEQRPVPRVDARLTVTERTWFGLRPNDGRQWGPGRLTACRLRVTATWRSGRRTSAAIWPYGTAAAPTMGAAPHGRALLR